MFAVVPVVCEGFVLGPFVCFGSWCLFLLGIHFTYEEIAVLCLYLLVPWVGLQSVYVAFCGTHFTF